MWRKEMETRRRGLRESQVVCQTKSRERWESWGFILRFDVRKWRGGQGEEGGRRLAESLSDGIKVKKNWRIIVAFTQREGTRSMENGDEN